MVGIPTYPKNSVADYVEDAMKETYLAYRREERSSMDANDLTIDNVRPALPSVADLISGTVAMTGDVIQTNIVEILLDICVKAGTAKLRGPGFWPFALLKDDPRVGTSPVCLPGVLVPVWEEELKA